MITKCEIILSLKKIYGNNYVFDVDNDKSKLSKLNFTFANTKIPDIVVFKEKCTILIEMKEIVENIKDLHIKEVLKSNKPNIGFFVPDLNKIFMDDIKKSNNQLKEFIQNNKNILNPLAVTLISSNRIMTNFTIPDIMEKIYGFEIEDYSSGNIKINGNVFNENKYTTTNFIGVYDGYKKFNIFYNVFCKNKLKELFFITIYDEIYFLLENKIEKGKRIMKFGISRFDKKDEVIYFESI